MSEQTLDTLMRILKQAQGNTLDICYTLYNEYVSKAENPSEVLQQILQYEDFIGSQDAPSEIIEDELKDNVFIKYYSLLLETVRFIVRENPTVEVFYHNLYEDVFCASNFPKAENERAVILWMLAEKIPVIPYYEAFDLLKMSNEEYREAVMRIKLHLKQAVHMLNRHFASRTEETSQLVRIASKIENEHDRIVYWSVLLHLLRKTKERALEDQK